MTIHSFFLLAGAVLWIYLLLCLTVKLCRDRIRQHKHRKQRVAAAKLLARPLPEKHPETVR